MKKLIGKIARALVSEKVYRTFRLGFKIVPKYYEVHIDDLEKFIDIKNKSSGDEAAAVLSLRKQAHMLDKGLQRRDFEVGHSTKVHQNAIGFLDTVRGTSYADDPSVIWSEGKIAEYEFRQEFPNEIGSRTDALRESYESCSVLRDLIRSRRSVRDFKSDHVSAEVLEECVEAINWAPSSCNKQPIYVYATNNPTKALRCAANAKGFTGFGDALPCFMSVCVDMRGYLLPSEMYLPGIDASLGAQNMLLMMASKGLSSSVLSWAQKDSEEERNLRAELKIPDYCSIIFNIAVGYPQNTPPIPARKSVKNTLRIFSDE